MTDAITAAFAESAINYALFGITGIAGGFVLSRILKKKALAKKIQQDKEAKERLEALEKNNEGLK